MPAEREGPPEREEPGTTPSTGPNHKSGITKPTNPGTAYSRTPTVPPNSGGRTVRPRLA